jgi:hypothetical protein
MASIAILSQPTGAEQPSARITEAAELCIGLTRSSPTTVQMTLATVRPADVDSPS